MFVCYDGSDAAGRAIATVGALLAGREAIVAYFLPAIDDGVVLRSTLPWPVSGATQEALAAVDRGEALLPADVGARGVAIAESVGLEARSLALGDEGLSIEEEANAWFALSEAAAAERASCVVVGHRRSEDRLSHLGSTAYGLVHHANRPVLVVPAD
jgi:nucleotide-binding universal stress UspA family protein